MQERGERTERNRPQGSKHTPEGLYRTGLKGEARKTCHVRRQESSSLCPALALNILQKQPVHAVEDHLRRATSSFPHVYGNCSGSNRSDDRWDGCIVMHNLSNSFPREVRADQQHEGCGIPNFLGTVIIWHLSNGQGTACTATTSCRTQTALTRENEYNATP